MVLGRIEILKQVEKQKKIPTFSSEYLTTKEEEDKTN